MPKNFWK